MEETENRVVQHHPRAGVTHHLLDSRPHFGLIAVNRTLGARRFLHAKWAAVQSAERVVAQGRTFRTQPVLGVMVTAAIQFNHRSDGLSLADHPLRRILFVSHGRHRGENQDLLFSESYAAGHGPSLIWIKAGVKKGWHLRRWDRATMFFSPTLVAVVLSAVLGAEAFPAEQEAAQAPRENEQRSFSVASYNICWGNLNLPKVVVGIREAKADLVLLQETNARSEIYLRRSLRAIYPNMYFRGNEGAFAAERFGILSKAPVGGLKFLRPRDGLFGAWRGQTKLAGRTLQIANVHLQPIIVDSRQGITGLLRAYAAMEQTHRREIEYVCENLLPDVPTLVAGDFNSTSSFLAPTFLIGKGFVDSFAAVTKNPDSHCTWHWLIGQAELSLRIDYIFHTRHARTLESRILKSDASDHHLVVSRLEWIGDGANGGKARSERAVESSADK